MGKLGDTGREISEITSEVKTSNDLAKLQAYGTENLPCGDISGNELKGSNTDVSEIGRRKAFRSQ